MKEEKELRDEFNKILAAQKAISTQAKPSVERLEQRIEKALEENRRLYRAKKPLLFDKRKIWDWFFAWNYNKPALALGTIAIFFTIGYFLFFDGHSTPEQHQKQMAAVEGKDSTESVADAQDDKINIGAGDSSQSIEKAKPDITPETLLAVALRPEKEPFGFAAIAPLAGEVVIDSLIGNINSMLARKLKFKTLKAGSQASEWFYTGSGGDRQKARFKFAERNDSIFLFLEKAALSEPSDRKLKRINESIIKKTKKVPYD